MATAQEMDYWLEKSNDLLQSLLPEDAGIEIYGKNLTPGDFANLIDNEFLKVDQTLISMSTVEHVDQLKEMFSNLEDDTAVALFSRWAQYMRHWKLHPNPQHWVPVDSPEIWRAILLSMKYDKSWSKDIAKQILSKWFLDLQ